MSNEQHIAQPAAASLAAAQQTPVTIDAIFSLRLPLDPQISPDGKQVAFPLYEWLPDQPVQRSRIWLVDTAGGEPRPFSNGEHGDDEPRWSPDSQRIAFTSQRGDDRHPQLYIMPVEGGEARRVCAMPNGASDIAWSPDARRIAFLSLEGAEPGTEPKVNEEERHRRLWTVRPESDTPEPVTPPNVTIWYYAWSPDSEQLAVYYSAGPTESDWYRGQIGDVPAGGGAIRQISALTRQAGALTWSRDGQRLYYVSGEWSDRPLVGGDVYVQSIAGGEARNLTPGIECNPSWLGELPGGPDGAGGRLLYVAWAGLSNRLGILNTVSDTRTVLSSDFYIGHRAWPHVSATPDLRTFVTTHSDQQHGDNIWLGELHGEPGAETVQWRQLTRLNPIAEETFQLAPSERISFEGADGWRIEGLYTPPLNPKEGQLPPLVLNVHGGPTSAFRDTWLDFMAPQLSTAGYAVLRINPRGSMGRGVAFSDAVLGDMGGKDFEDLMGGVDYVIERGLADGNRLAIIGWSYGGFMTAWAVTQTNRFKAAMVGAGVTDFHSFHAQSNIGNWDEDFIAANWLEQPNAYRERSALTYAARVTTPTLIVHGEQDPCVPVNQAYAFYRALRERGVTTELAVYPREGHGFRERDHTRDLYERLLRWLDRYV